MKAKRIIVYPIWILFVMFFGLNTRLLISYSAETNESLGFSYENVIPKNQISDNTFFELKVKPDTKQVLRTKITNLTGEEKIIRVTVSNATSGSVGVINYGANKEKLLGKNTLSIKDIVEYPSQVKLKPYEEKEVKFKLTIPKKEFDGIILGGVHLKEIKEKKEETAGTTASLSNEYSYVYSISLKENEREIKPNFTSSGTRYNKMLYVNVNNIQPIILSGVNVNMILMAENDDKVINDFKVENYRMAPNTGFDLPVEGTEDLPLGKYRAQTIVTYGKEQWKFNSKFEVTKENKKGMSEVFEEEKQKKRINGVLIIFIVFSFVITIIAFYFYLDRRTTRRRK